MSEELKPCRKCGHKAELHNSLGSKIIYCTNYGACCPTVQSERDDDVALLVEIWNGTPDYAADLAKILYPEGCKHPQQREWKWLLERAKELHKL